MTGPMITEPFVARDDVMDDWPKMSRETRLFVAKVAMIASDLLRDRAVIR